MRFETLIEQFHDEIYGYLWRLVDGAGQVDHLADAEDLTQEVFLRAYRSYGRLRPDSNHRAWLYRIATNCAYSALKRGRQAPRSLSMLEEAGDTSLPVDAGPSPYQVVVRQETLSSLNLALAGLPLKQQAAVVMRYLQGLDYTEIAQALACSEDSARANVYQGVRRLRRELGEELQFEAGE